MDADERVYTKTPAPGKGAAEAAEEEEAQS